MESPNQPCSSSVEQSGSVSRQTQPPRILQMTRFDQVTSFFVAMIVLLSVFVALMFVIWVVDAKQLADKQSRIERSSPSSSPAGYSDDFEPPSREEVQELIEPSLVDALQAISDSVSRVLATYASAQTDSMDSSNGTNSDGMDLREHGPGPADGIDLSKRWEITFNTHGKKDYAAQLDFFAIELAAFGGGINVIETASNLASTPTRKVIEDPGSEDRLYFSWKQTNELARFDQQLLSAAGIRVTGRNLVRFIPTELESQLLELEKQHCEAHGMEFPDSIVRTVFESRQSDGGFAFQVIQQRYRRAAK